MAMTFWHVNSLFIKNGNETKGAVKFQQKMKKVKQEALAF